MAKLFSNAAFPQNIVSSDYGIYELIWPFFNRVQMIAFG
jgi:hypothetical protein